MRIKEFEYVYGWSASGYAGVGMSRGLEDCDEGGKSRRVRGHEVEGRR